MELKKRFTLSLKNSLRFLPDRTYINLYYYAKFGGFPDIDNPRTFNEKIQWMKLNYQDPRLSNLVDKLEVRSFVQKIIGAEYLVPLIEVFDTVEDFAKADLPNEFVVKCTHDSQSTHVCSSKEAFEIDVVVDELRVALRRNWFWQGREWAYKNCKPRIIVEEYLKEPGKTTPNDYKFYCFNGKVEMVQTDTDRFESRHAQQYYSPTWESYGDWDRYTVEECNQMGKPHLLEQMIELSERLAAGFPHVRVDWYCIEGSPLFGELTFYTGGGFDPFHSQENKLDDWLDKKLGELLVLPVRANGAW